MRCASGAWTRRARKRKGCCTPSFIFRVRRNRCATLPLADLVSVTRGGELDFGRRFVAAGDGPPMLVH